MQLAIVAIVAGCAGIVTGAILHKWSQAEIPPQESVFFRSYQPPAPVTHVGRHRRYDAFPISNMVRLPSRALTTAEEQDLNDTMGFLAAVRDDPIPMPPVPEPLMIEQPPTWTQEHVWGKSLEEMVAELEQEAYAAP